MNTANQQPEQQEPASVDVAAIERELTSLWKSAGEDFEDGGVIRASLLNLIIYSPDLSESAKLDDLVVEITAAHPCRAILTMADREAVDSSITAQVTSRCTLPTAMSKQVCCEQVTIIARRSQIDDVVSVITPLLLSDLPVYLWWRAVPRLEDKAFRRLVDASDRVIIDSADFAEPYKDLSSLAGVLRDKPRWAAFSDLNWARLSAWRALIAGFYDIVEYRSLLDQIDRVVIEYAPPSEDQSAISPRALLLAGWLASRLGWRLNAETNNPALKQTSYVMTAGNRDVTVEFVPARSAEIEPGHLARATITSAADRAASFIVNRSGDGNRIETEVSVGEKRHIQRVLSYENCSESVLIGRELEIMGHDRVYEQAVRAAGEFIGVG